MTDPRAALAEVLRKRGYVGGVASRYGTFNDAYWEKGSNDLSADLAERGVLLVTEPLLREALERMGHIYAAVNAPDIFAGIAALSAEVTE